MGVPGPRKKARKKGTRAAAGGEAAPALFRTGEVMKRGGVSRQLLYQYTAMGLIEEAETTEAGHRLYPADVFARLELIKELNDSGYPLREIREIFFRRRK